MVTRDLAFKMATTNQRPGKLSSLIHVPYAAGRTFIRRGINYTTLVLWALRDSFRGHTLGLIGIVVFSGIYLAAQAGAILLLYWYAQQMQADGGLALPQLGIDWHARTDVRLLWTVVVSATILFVVSAVFLFGMRRMVFGIVGEGYQRGLETVPRLVVRLPDPRAPMASRLAVDFGFGRLLAGCRQSTMAMVAFSNAVPPFIGSLGAIGFLIWSDPLLTLMMLAAFMLWATLLYPVALRGSQATLQSERAHAKYHDDVQRLRRSYDLDGTTPELPSADAFVRAYLGVRGIKHEIALVIQIGATVIVALAVLYIAWRLMSGGSDWPILLAYIAALRLALAGGSGAVSAFASISRFYPRMVRYALFMKSAATLDQEALGSLTPGEAALLGRLPTGGEVMVKAGDRLAIVTWDDRKEVELALLGARSVSTRLPLGATWWNPATRNVPPEATLLLVEAASLTAPKVTNYGCDEALETKVVLIVHNDPTKVGDLGETDLLVVNNRAIGYFLPIATAKDPRYLAIFAKFERRGSRIGSDHDREEDEEEF
jgi:hypothetical protein